MSELSEQHDVVRYHPYRQDENPMYLKDYKKQLEELSTLFWRAVRDTKYKRAGNMCHDFNVNVYNIGRINKDGSESQFASPALLFVEQGIGVIHTFIDTGEVPYYYDKFKVEGEVKTCKVEWNEREEKYYIVT